MKGSKLQLLLNNIHAGQNIIPYARSTLFTLKISYMVLMATYKGQTLSEYFLSTMREETDESSSRTEGDKE